MTPKVIVLTDEIKEKIKNVYSTHNGGVVKLARELGIHYSLLNYYAIRLGYYPNNSGVRRGWSEEEIELVRRHPEMTHVEIAKLLRRSFGSFRKVPSIKKLRHRIGWRSEIYRDQEDVGYSLGGISEVMGVSSGIVRNWFAKGLFKGKNIPGDNKAIRVKRTELRNFLIENVHIWEPAKCDKYWLVDILVNKQAVDFR